MSETVAFLILFGVPVLIVLVEVFDWLIGIVRRSRASGVDLAELQGPFTLRRPDSELRARHRYRARFTSGRPSEIVHHQVEPHVR